MVRRGHFQSFQGSEQRGQEHRDSLCRQYAHTTTITFADKNHSPVAGVRRNRYRGGPAGGAPSPLRVGTRRAARPAFRSENCPRNRSETRSSSHRSRCQGIILMSKEWLTYREVQRTPREPQRTTVTPTAEAPKAKEVDANRPPSSHPPGSSPSCLPAEGLVSPACSTAGR